MDDFWYQTEDFNGNDGTEEDVKPNLKLIEKIRNENNLFELIVESLCPQIYGQQFIKCGLVLSLFSGVRKHDRQSKQLSVRSHIHVLLFGDPGSKKDILLKAVHSIAPNARYVCGSVSQLNSLTSVKRSRTEEHFQNGCLESKKFAVCCVDDFEAMDVRQHQVIEEVMEYQSFTYNCFVNYKEVSANTSMIGAVNPLNGCYDWTSNVWQNTKLKKSLLSKFDLIFVLIDFPDKDIDSEQTKHILESRRNEDKDNYNKTNRKMNMFSQTTNCETNDCQLINRFTKLRDEELDLIPHKFLKQYLIYAHKYVNPVLDEEATQLLEQFCTKLESTEISKSETRTIETLYRLTEARARLELRGVATKQDVLDVIDIVRYSVGQLFRVQNVFHSLNTQMSFKSSKKSQNTKNLLKALKMNCETTQQKSFTYEEIVEICHRFGIPFDSRDEISISVEKLNEKSFLLKTNSNNYKLID